MVYIIGALVAFHHEVYICYSPAGRSVLGETVPEVLSTARGRGRYSDRGHNFFQYGPTEAGEQHFYFFPTESEKFQENFTSASNLCVLKKGAFMLNCYSKRAIDCTPKQNITT